MINREHKDRLFSFIFGSNEHKDWTLSLYNAVNGSNHKNPEEIEINTISDILYMGMRNDVSFIVREDMNLYAHQSTYNPNMPLRELIYVGQLYSKYVTKKKANIYGKKLIRIPVPKLVVFYNGSDDADDETILELKDLFMDGSEPEKADISLRVKMLNIHSNKNKKLLGECKPLYEYAVFTDKICEYRKTMEIEEAVSKALEEISDDWLIKKYLIENKAEVTTMCLYEYNEEETMQMFKEEGREEGLETGVRAVVELCKSYGGSSVDAVEQIVASMGFSQPEADRLVSKYW